MMMMIRRLLPYLAAAGLALSATQASGMQVSSYSLYLNGFTYSPPTVVTLQSAAPGTLIAPFNAYAGQYSGTLNGKSFLTYCAEITQYLYFNTLYTDYTIVGGVTAWGAAKSTMLDHMISAFIGANVSSNASGSGLVQAAIWEILYETAPTYGFGSGSFNIASSNNLQIQSSPIDWSSIEAAPVQYHVDLLHSATAQDLVVIAPVALPEPSSYALLVAGLAGFGFVARRRRSVRR